MNNYPLNFSKTKFKPIYHNINTINQYSQQQDYGERTNNHIYNQNYSLKENKPMHNTQQSTFNYIQDKLYDKQQTRNKYGIHTQGLYPEYSNHQYLKLTNGDDHDLINNTYQSQQKDTESDGISDQNSQSEYSESEESEETTEESGEEDNSVELKETIQKNINIQNPTKKQIKETKILLKDLKLQQNSQLLNGLNKMTLMSKKENIDILLNNARLSVKNHNFKFKNESVSENKELIDERIKIDHLKRQIHRKMKQIQVTYFNQIK